MNILRKRPVAAIICVIVIALSTIYSAHRSLGAKVRELTDSFYTGVYSEEQDRTLRSISSQLDKRCEAANGLVALSEKYVGEIGDEKAADILRNSRLNLMKSTDITEKYLRNKDIDAAFNSLHAELEMLDLPERDTAMLEEYTGIFRGAQTLINSSGYNEAVRSFERNTLGAFPANILKEVAFVPRPVLFE